MADWISEYQSFSSQDWKPTTLNSGDEAKFRTWIQGTKLFNSVKSDIALENKVDPAKLDNNRVIDMLSEQGDYDYRGAWKAGVKEVISKHDGRPHWPSSAGDKMLNRQTMKQHGKSFLCANIKRIQMTLGCQLLNKRSNGLLKDSQLKRLPQHSVVLNDQCS